MTEIVRIDCTEFKKVYNLNKVECCESCHEDMNMGFGEDLWLTADSKEWNICCQLMRAYEKKMGEN